ncbi:aldehyde dehydrogenase family protein [Qingshengfaniella alkalisoli]|uniref:aldehyde dehydrogenase (NAD(+)) n=1 Tax=Qingshengfaniella alkalisoli TaxID=2599296 RepID=A0A5B8JBA0_9RHOB|nr:aldehyde dehydrogenase family protein [Qingshengfaniella alkalisoli]QDY71557.1 aldehyde dehydrogenase family protein [Qingshengfaniella alkalisoli]
MTNLQTGKFYIDGKWVDPAGTETLEVINPATEEAFATIAMGNRQDVEHAVAAAKTAFETFSQTTKAERIELLEGILAAYERRYDEMSAIICEELGAPISLCDAAQSMVGVGHLKGFLDALRNMEFREEMPSGDTIYREPIGVCGMITPWNWPINQIALKVLPAFAAGCTVVLKPSEITPLNALLYAEILDEAGVPKGVFNLVNGDGLNVGSAISRHPDVAMVSFTGSTRAGRQVSIDAAETIKRVTLELGGKSPNIVFADTDLADAVTGGVRHCFQNSGQSCNAPTRMLVEASIYDEAMDIAREAAENTLVGSPTDQGKHIGPLVSAIQYERVQELIQAGIDEGATLLAGGTGRPEGSNRGYFVKPTVFGNVNNQMRIAREEVFGPVLAMIPFKDEAEAVEIANDTPYGLAAQIQSGDTERAEAVARKLRAGMVHINGSDIDFGSPFGGYKMSGNGREGGKFGIEDFLEIKAVSRP